MCCNALEEQLPAVGDRARSIIPGRAGELIDDLVSVYAPDFYLGGGAREMRVDMLLEELRDLLAGAPA